MQLTLHNEAGLNLIRSVQPGAIQIDEQRYSTSLLVLPDAIEPWSVQEVDAFDELAAKHLLESHPDLIIFGSGRIQRFPTTDVLRTFRHAGMGFEVMDTLAACRTYNVLVSEGRRVMAALIQAERSG